MLNAAEIKTQISFINRDQTDLRFFLSSRTKRRGSKEGIGKVKVDSRARRRDILWIDFVVLK